MKYSRLLLLPGIFISHIFYNEIKAQEASDVENVFKVNVISPGISYEMRIANKQTLYTEAYLALYYAFSYSSNFGSDSEFRAMPSLDVAYRYYYNGRSRANRGVTTAMNNMNYLTFVYNPGIYQKAVYTYYDYQTKPALQHTIGVGWGFQRNYANRISLDMHVGPGCVINTLSEVNAVGESFSELNVEPTLVLKMRIGFWLNKRRD